MKKFYGIVGRWHIGAFANTVAGIFNKFKSALGIDFILSGAWKGEVARGYPTVVGL